MLNNGSALRLSSFALDFPFSSFASLSLLSIDFCAGSVCLLYKLPINRRMSVGLSGI